MKNIFNMKLDICIANDTQVKNCILLSLVQKSIEIQAWLFLTFLKFTKSISINSIVAN